MAKKPKTYVNKDMIIADIVSLFPEAADVIMSYGIHCVGHAYLLLYINIHSNIYLLSKRHITTKRKKRQEMNSSSNSSCLLLYGYK